MENTSVNVTVSGRRRQCVAKCSVCCHQNDKLYRLTPQELLLLDTVFSCVSMCRLANVACRQCLEHLYRVKALLKAIVLSEPPSPTMKRSDDDPEHINSYNCRCAACRRKFGALPLLVDVIEATEREAQASTSRGEPPPRKEMPCRHCGKSFTHKGDLNKHLRRHTGEKPFACAGCDKKFAHSSNLARHTLLHSGDRPFRCEVCAKEFSRKDKLELHRKSHMR